MMRISFLMAVLLLLIPVMSASADVVTLEPTKDAFVCDCDPGTTNPFGLVTLLAQGRPSACFHKFFIEWDLSSIPEEADITSAELRLFVYSVYGGGPGELVYYRVIEDWSETTVCYNNMPDYTEDGGLILSNWPTSGWYSVDVTDFVIGWNTGTTENYGLHCGSQNISSPPKDAIYYSSRASASLRPRLVVTYTVTALDRDTWGGLKVPE